MVKLKGPIMSLEAHGSIGKILTFSERGSGSQTRKYTKPIKAPSAKQRAQRRLTEFLVAQWQNMTENQKDVYEDAAKATGKQISGYHYFLSVAQRDLYAHTKLCAYWSFNEIVGDQVLDLSGNANHGTLKPTFPSDAPTLATARSKRFGSALSFNGSSDNIQCPNTPSLNITDVLTLEAWVYPAALSGNLTVMNKYWSHYGMEVYGNFFRVMYRNEVPTTKVIDTHYRFPVAEKWYCLTFVMVAGDTLYFYVNGTPAGDESIAFVGNSIESNLDPLSIGCVGGNSSYFNGKLDELCIYNRALSAAEILTRYRFATKEV